MKKKVVLSSFLIALTVLMAFSFMSFTVKSVEADLMEAAPIAIHPVTPTVWECENVIGGCEHRGRVAGGGGWGPWVFFQDRQPPGYLWLCAPMRPPHSGMQCEPFRIV